eukprot:TRINITY_DN9638_c0_g1_i5.p1 TRINITY_DN9638_c0_g1~~TRINITY_DN9638_c0_g1_i5.p1  ORF type:complete len:175 (+),score=31.32 TRINITY_DN9638_c0_g1_i5:80-604(+)
MIRRPPRSTQGVSSAASDVYKRQYQRRVHGQKNDFIIRNKFDDHQDVTESKEIPGLNEFSLVRITDEKPCMIGLGYYWLFAIIGMAEFYKLYVNSFCIEQCFTIKKIVSSRQNLSAPENKGIYQEQVPVIMYRQKTRRFDHDPELIKFHQEPSNINFDGKMEEIPPNENTTLLP